MTAVYDVIKGGLSFPSRTLHGQLNKKEPLKARLRLSKSSLVDLQHRTPATFHDTIIPCLTEKIKDVLHVPDSTYLNSNLHYVISNDYKILLFSFRLSRPIKELMMSTIFRWASGPSE